MKILEYYKHQLKQKYDLIDSAVMKEYYNLSRFLNHTNIGDKEILDHIISLINTLSSEKLEIISKAARRLKDTMLEVIPMLENTFINMEHLEIVMIIGDGYIDGHGILVDSKPYVVIDLGTIAESIDEYDLEVFLIHEIIHALHYIECPAMYFRNYNGLSDDYIKRLVSEGIATYTTGRLHSKESGYEYWLGHLSLKETDEWIDLCELRKNEVSERLSLSIELNQIDSELYYKLFSVFDPDRLKDSRTGYYYGSKVCESLAGKVQLNNILGISVDEWYNTTCKYFGISGLKREKSSNLDVM